MFKMWEDACRRMQIGNGDMLSMWTGISFCQRLSNGGHRRSRLQGGSNQSKTTQDRVYALTPGKADNETGLE
jgi:hypothetical protein